MFNRVVQTGPAFIASALTVALSLITASDAVAQTPSVSVGGGVRTSASHTAVEEADGVTSFPLESVRLYVNGTATDKIKVMFNTEYNGAGNDVEVLDAVGQIDLSKTHHVWFGRFLPPSDRSNLYGPYYAHHWAVYTDGVQDGYPMIFQGRLNGAMYWGQYGKVKVSGGAFDGTTATGDPTVIGAGRVQVDFWDAEDGYYLNGTYYGDKNLLALGAATQMQGSDKAAYTVDFLMERKVTGGGAFTVEAEWAKYDKLGGYSARHGSNTGGYVLGSYLFPALVGGGRFELLGKVASARFREGVTALDLDYDQTTSEVNVNYVMKQFNGRLMMFYKDTRFDAVRANTKQIGVGLQVQM